MRLNGASRSGCQRRGSPISLSWTCRVVRTMTQRSASPTGTKRAACSWIESWTRASGQPFDPRKAVERFANVLKEYGLRSVTGDKYAGETFKADFQGTGISYRVSELTKSELYEEIEPLLNGGRIVLLDQGNLESQLLGLVWRGGKIDHPNGEHDDYANGAAGALHLASKNKVFNPRAVPTAVGTGIGAEIRRQFGTTFDQRGPFAGSLPEVDDDPDRWGGHGVTRCWSDDDE